MLLPDVEHTITLFDRQPIEHYHHYRLPLLYQERTSGEPFSRAYFCRLCGSVWAEDRVSSGDCWVCEYQRCKEHGIGSLFVPQGRYQEWEDMMPLGVLLLELNVAIKCLEQGGYYGVERHNSGWENIDE